MSEDSRLGRKLEGARDHVGGTGHREWVLDQYARLAEGTANWEHRVGCLDCGFEIWVSMEDIAESGRLDLLDRHGLGAELESIKRTRPVDRVADWDRILSD